jgi:hypothetical protein
LSSGQKKKTNSGTRVPIFFCVGDLSKTTFGQLFQNFENFSPTWTCVTTTLASIINNWNNIDPTPTHDANDGFIIAQSSTKITLTWPSSDLRD